MWKSLFFLELFSLQGTAAELRPQTAERAAILRQEIQGIHISFAPATGSASFVSKSRAAGSLASTSVAAKRDPIAVFLARHGCLFGIADPTRELKRLSSEPDYTGFMHHFYQQV